MKLIHAAAAAAAVTTIAYQPAFGTPWVKLVPEVISFWVELHQGMNGGGIVTTGTPKHHHHQHTSAQFFIGLLATVPKVQKAELIHYCVSNYINID